jgi:phosphoribosyl 1,2-cyclic phosphodiesterase
MDHIQGLGFFSPLYNPAIEVHLWGPASSTLSLDARLSRYLSPPLFPIHLRDLPSVSCHHVPRSSFDIGPFRILTALVSHPGPTVGFRIEADGGVISYLSDHEPALCLRNGLWPGREWVSGFDLAAEADLLIHDAQYTDEEYDKWDGAIARTDTRSNSHLTSAQESLLHFLTTRTATTICWTVCRKMRFGT